MVWEHAQFSHIGGHPYITYAPRGEGGSVKIGILRTGAYGGEGRGPDRCVRTHRNWCLFVYFVVGYNYIALLGRCSGGGYTTRNTHYWLHIPILYSFIHWMPAREIKLDFRARSSWADYSSLCRLLNRSKSTSWRVLPSKRWPSY